MPSTLLRIFVSSRRIGLEPERQATRDVLDRMRGTEFVGMEIFGSRDEDAEHASVGEVDASDLYIGIVGHSYGTGITEKEYRRARERRIHCLIYLKQGDDDGDPRLTGWKQQLPDDHLVTWFDDASPLAAYVPADVPNWILATLDARLALDPATPRRFVRGIDQLPTDYATRIENFVAEYLGTPDEPVPFGGREDRSEERRGG